MSSKTQASDPNSAQKDLAPPPPVASAAKPQSVRCYGNTDRGRVRHQNEDQFLIAELNKSLRVLGTSLGNSAEAFTSPVGHVFVVADGVGGSAGGEKASALAVDAIEVFMVDTLHWCFQLRGSGEDRLLGEFQRALRLADARIQREARRRPELHGMGTTLTLAYSLDGELFIAHVGDSRCYLLRNGLLYRLTRDHTLAAEMVRRGILPAEEAEHHGFRHVITNVVGGTDPGVQAEVHKLLLQVGDRMLLCSDGLTEMLPDSVILPLLQQGEDPAAICQQLIYRANDAGGRDNITAVVAFFES
jgi:protein phosphatase